MPVANPRNIELQKLRVGFYTDNGASVYIMEVVSASLDIKFCGQVAAELHQLAEKDRQLVVAVSHDPRSRSYARRIVVVSNGRLI